MKSRVSCLLGLAPICNQQKDWARARQSCEEALELLELMNVPSFDAPETRLNYHIFFLVQLGDALSVQEEWVRARHFDKQAFTFWASQAQKGIHMSARRRDGLALLRARKPLDAWERMRSAVYLYKNDMDVAGIKWTQLDVIVPAMALIKVWAESSFLTGSIFFRGQKLKFSGL